MKIKLYVKIMFLASMSHYAQGADIDPLHAKYQQYEMHIQANKQLFETYTRDQLIETLNEIKTLLKQGKSFRHTLNALQIEVRNRQQKQAALSGSTPSAAQAQQCPSTSSAAGAAAQPPSLTSTPEPFLCTQGVYTDWTGQVKRQEGATCGYHAVWNAAQLMAYLKTKDINAANKLLREGPPLAQWQTAIGRNHNINDEEAARVAFQLQGLNPNDVTIIPNIREWTPALDATFANVAHNLQNTIGAVHGFILGTATHISVMTPEIQALIRSTLHDKPQLAQAFENALKNNQKLPTQTENAIAQLLFTHHLPDTVKQSFRAMGTGEHKTSVGHWVAVVATNTDGVINLHIANSSYDTMRKEFGNREIVELLYAWLTKPQRILEAFIEIPNRIGTALASLDQTYDIQTAQERLAEINRIIEGIPGLRTDPHFISDIEPSLKDLELAIEQRLHILWAS